MQIEVRPVEVDAIAPLRDEFRANANCQIVHDSILPRRLADVYLVTCAGEVAGYGGVWNKYFPNRVVEFYPLENHRERRGALFGAFVEVSGATELEAQTNMPMMLDLLEEFGSTPIVEKLLFEDGSATALACPKAIFRRRRPAESGPEGEWVVDLEGEIVAAGGVMTHYNPPYGDLYMEVRLENRRQGLGSFIVQELRRVCRESGLVPAARCDPDNTASRRALERGGMALCGSLLAASLQ